MQLNTQGVGLVRQWLEKLQALRAYFEEKQNTIGVHLVKLIEQSILLLTQQMIASSVLQGTLQRIVNFLSYRTSISLLVPEIAHATEYQSLDNIQVIQLKRSLFNCLHPALLTISNFSSCFDEINESDRLLINQFNQLIPHLRLAQHLFQHFTPTKKSKRATTESSSSVTRPNPPLPPSEFLLFSGLIFKELQEMAAQTKQAYPQEALDIQAQREDDGSGLIQQGSHTQAAFVFSIKVIAPEYQPAAQSLLITISDHEKFKVTPRMIERLEKYQAACHEQIAATNHYSAYYSYAPYGFYAAQYQKRLQKETVFSSLLSFLRSDGITPSLLHQLAADKPFLFKSLFNSEAEKWWNSVKSQLKHDLRKKALQKKDAHGFFICNKNVLAHLAHAISNLPSTMLPGQANRVEQRKQLTGNAQAHHDKKYALSFLLEKARVGELCFADLEFVKESFPRYQERFYLFGKSNTTKLIEKIEQELTEQLWMLLGGEGAVLRDYVINEKSRKLAEITAPASNASLFAVSY